MINLTNKNKAEVLAKLYNAAKPQGLGFLNFDPTEMTIKDAQILLDGGQTYSDYLKGRVIIRSLAL